MTYEEIMALANTMGALSTKLLTVYKNIGYRYGDTFDSLGDQSVVFNLSAKCATASEMLTRLAHDQESGVTPSSPRKVQEPMLKQLTMVDDLGNTVTVNRKNGSIHIRAHDSDDKVHIEGYGPEGTIDQVFSLILGQLRAFKPVEKGGASDASA